jgi:hypothetical protein
MLQMFYFVSVAFVYCMHLSSTLHVLLGIVWVIISYKMNDFLVLEFF